MGEQVVLSISAHVFQIDPVTKRSWKPLGTGNLPVSILRDAAKNTFRVVAKDGDNAVVNSAIGAKMAFTKTSPKFGQWQDPRASTVYGIGFSTEDSLKQFQTAFESALQAKPTPTPAPKRDTSGGGGGDGALSSASTMAPGSQASLSRGLSSTPSAKASGGDQTQVQELRYENERLKIALSTSSANAKEWVQELSTLKNNNARLKVALQESAANVNEWKEQLTAWKEESTRLKARNKELEAAAGNGHATNAELDAKTAECEELKARIAQLEGSNRSMAMQSQQANASVGRMERCQKDLQDWEQQFASKLREFTTLHSQFEDILKQSN
eukprot:m.94686 g.94686  ORF g.94686 m.94686 type:complete len:327 (-) comp16560_c0_seq1:24-1004(-)